VAHPATSRLVQIMNIDFIVPLPHLVLPETRRSLRSSTRHPVARGATTSAIHYLDASSEPVVETKWLLRSDQVVIWTRGDELHSGFGTPLFDAVTSRSGRRGRLSAASRLSAPTRSGSRASPGRSTRRNPAMLRMVVSFCLTKRNKATRHSQPHARLDQLQ
jgi:hypothetical protein